MIKRLRESQRIACLIFPAILAGSTYCLGNGSNLGKIYHPYVQQLEKELEFEIIFQSDSRQQFDDRQSYRLAYGQSLSDDVLLEFGVTGRNTPNTGFDINVYELEVKWQLTEQGEFANDWALLTELEYERDGDIWELGTTLVVLHEWKKWIGTANLGIAYETGDSVDEFETALASSLRYRYRPAFEPGIEYFKNEDTNAIGPAISGQLRLGGRRKLFWGLGMAFSLDSSKPDSTIRANLEYEF